MGRVRTKTIKRGAKVLLEKYYQKLTSDFHVNKKILSEVGQVPSKRLRNKIAGYATHLMKRIQKGPVKGISLKVQEEERERRLDWVPTKSEINLEKVEIDNETLDMLTKRFGTDFVGKISNNISAKASEVPKAKENRDRGNRRGGRDGARPKREGKPEGARGDGERKPVEGRGEAKVEGRGEAKPDAAKTEVKAEGRAPRGDGAKPEGRVEREGRATRDAPRPERPARKD